MVAGDHEINSEPAIRSFQREIITLATDKLGSPLTAKEDRFVTSRLGFIALEVILDTVKAATATEVEAYLNSE